MVGHASGPRHRQGWIFITSLPAEREALRPLQSLWIDLLVLRLLNEPKPDQRPVWFVIDELASLQKLPQFHTAITENRKSSNPLILGFQGKAQLEVPLRPLGRGHAVAAGNQHLAQDKGAECWRVGQQVHRKSRDRADTETHFDGSRGGRNFALDRQIEPLVMESEITGLPDLHAYMKYRELRRAVLIPLAGHSPSKPKFIERLEDDYIVREPQKGQPQAAKTEDRIESSRPAESKPTEIGGTTKIP